MGTIVIENQKRLKVKGLKKLALQKKKMCIQPKNKFLTYKMYNTIYF